VGAYLLALASLMAGSGRLADLFGRRRLFLLGVTLFGLSSLACALAPSDLSLIVARVAQGTGAALTQPLALANATAIMPPERRGWTIGALASAGTICLMVGPLLGGVLVEAVGWRSVFLLNVPVVVLAVGLGLRYMPETREPAPSPLDVWGLGLLTTGLVGLVAGLLHMQEWPIAVDAAVLALAALILGAFVAVEQRSEHPLLPLRLLRPPEVASSMAALFTIQGAVLGVTVYVTLFLQNGLGLSAIEAGAVLLPAMIWTALLSTRTGQMAERRGERLPVGIGLLVAAAGLVAIGVLARGEEALLLIPGLVVFGVSRPFVFTPASTGPLKVIPADERGLASSLVTESRQLGAVLAVAALGAIAAAFEGAEGTGGSGAGLEAGMFAAAGLALVVGTIALVTLPRGQPAPAAR
jgi:EmrB/QacA subfamily drug resistance transporter